MGREDRIMKLVSLICFFMSFSALTQAEIWTDRVGSNGNNYVYNVKIDPLTYDCYATGRVKGLCTFGEGTLNPQTPTDFGDRDVYLTKHDVDGELVWVKRFGGLYTDYGEAIELDDDYIYLGGYFTDTLYLDNDTLFSNGSQDAFIVKLNKDGDVIWHKTWGGAGDDRITEMKLVGNSLFAVGLYEDSIDFEIDTLINTIPVSNTSRESAFLMNMDTTGQVVWAENMQSSRGVRPVDITYADGFLYFVGNCYGNTEFGGNIYTSVNTVFYDQFVVKYDNNGNFVWAELFGNNLRDICTQVDVGDDDNLYVTGYFTGLVTYGPDTYDVPVQTGVILDLDTAGQVNNSFPTYSSNISLLDGLKFAEGRIFTGGYFQDSVFIQNDTLLGNGSIDIFYLELDEDLVPVDYFSMGGVSSDQIRCLDAVDGHLRVAGSFRYTVDFGSVSYTTLVNTYDGFIRAVCPKLLYDLEVSDTILCLGDTLQIINRGTWSDITALNTIAGLDSISFQNDTLSFLATTPGFYSVDLELSTHCSLDTVYGLEFNSYEVPIVDLGPDIIDCEDSTVILSYSGIQDSLLWSTSATNVDTIFIASSGIYFVEVWDTNFCSTTDSVVVTLNDCSGINETENQNIKFHYSDNTIHILNMEPFMTDYNFQIFDMKGAMVQSGKLMSSIFVNENLKEGIYLIQITSRLSTESYKIYISN
jgi:hypothetical protein